MKHEKLGLFAAGLLFGTAGIKLLTSKDAKKLYTHTTAAVLRMKDCVMTGVTHVRENAGDIYANAKEINEKRSEADAAAVIADTSSADEDEAKECSCCCESASSAETEE